MRRLSRFVLSTAVWGMTAMLGACGPATPSLPERVFGRTGMGLGELNYPRAAALSPDGTLYVVDKAARIQAFTFEGEPLFAWRMPEWTAGKPTGLGFASDGRLFIADTHYHRVQVYSADGKPLRIFGEEGVGPGQFRLPTDIAVAADGTIYVGEYGGNDRISRFTPDFRYIDSFGGPDSGVARLERPQGLAFDAEGTLWVADACNHRICHFAADGTFLGTFGELGSTAGKLRFPYNVEPLPDGTLVVVEYGNNRLQHFTRDGQSLGTWGSAGRSPGQLAYPWAVVANAAKRELFVIDSGNNRVQVLPLAGVARWSRGD